MARKKQAEVKKGSPEWMATFSDLMNLLLCFFVLLFAMSTVDGDKWDVLVTSMNNSFGLFDGGYSSIGEGVLINAGAAQLTELDEYYNTMGKSEEGESEEIAGGETQKTLDELLQDANMQETTYMYDNISEGLEQGNLEDYINLEMDPEGRYVELTISGTFLFDSGRADLKTDALPVMSKLGDVLKQYDRYLIEIIGHTDNVPMTSNTFADNDILSSARAISAKNYFVNTKGLDVTTMKWSGKGEYEPIASNDTVDGRARNRRVEIRIYNSLNSN